MCAHGRGLFPVQVQISVQFCYALWLCTHSRWDAVFEDERKEPGLASNRDSSRGRAWTRCWDGNEEDAAARAWSVLHKGSRVFVGQPTRKRVVHLGVGAQMLMLCRHRLMLPRDLYRRENKHRCAVADSVLLHHLHIYRVDRADCQRSWPREQTMGESVSFSQDSVQYNGHVHIRA